MTCTDEQMSVWYLGAKAWKDGNALDKNPYDPKDELAQAWADGWNAANEWKGS